MVYQRQYISKKRLYLKNSKIRHYAPGTPCTLTNITKSIMLGEPKATFTIAEESFELKASKLLSRQEAEGHDITILATAKISEPEGCCATCEGERKVCTSSGRPKKNCEKWHKCSVKACPDCQAPPAQAQAAVASDLSETGSRYSADTLSRKNTQDTFKPEAAYDYQVVWHDGVKFRNSPNMDDRVEEMGPNYNDIVKVMAVRGSWAHCANGLWLPITVGKHQVLEARDRLPAGVDSPVSQNSMRRASVGTNGSRRSQTDRSHSNNRRLAECPVPNRTKADARSYRSRPDCDV